MFPWAQASQPKQPKFEVFTCLSTYSVKRSMLKFSLQSPLACKGQAKLSHFHDSSFYHCCFIALLIIKLGRREGTPKSQCLISVPQTSDVWEDLALAGCTAVGHLKKSQLRTLIVMSCQLRSYMGNLNLTI